MTTLTIMRGYPGSGKSSIANQIVESTGAVRVSRDDIRQMFFGVPWTGKREDEELVTKAEGVIVSDALRVHRNVVVDACHVNPIYLRGWQKKAILYRAQFVIHDVKTPVDECVYRDAKRMQRGLRGTGEEVIRRMAEQFPIESWPKEV